MDSKSSRPASSDCSRARNSAAGSSSAACPEAKASKSAMLNQNDVVIGSSVGNFITGQSLVDMLCM